MTAVSAVSGWRSDIIDQAHHRKGIATEAVAAMLEFCFGELGIDRVQELIHPDNVGSGKLVEKLELRCKGLLCA